MHLVSHTLFKWVYSTAIAFNKYFHWNGSKHIMNLGFQSNHLSFCPFCLQIKFLKVEMEKKTKIIKDLQQEVSHQSFT